MADIEWCSIAPWLQDHILYDARILPVTCTNQPEGQMEDSDVPPEMGSQTLLDPHQIKTTNYCGPATGYQELELPGGLASPYTYSNVGHTPDVPEPVPVPFPSQEKQGDDLPRNNPQGVVPNSTQAPLPVPLAQRPPAPDQPAAKNLRRFARRCLDHPDSQVVMVRMEPGSADRYKVVIVVETADFL